MKALVATFLAIACATAFAHKGQRSERGWERVEANEPAPAFTLSNQEAQRVTLSGLRGKPLVIVSASATS